MGIFISYRRGDSSGQAGRLYDRLVARYGHDRVFRDIDAINPGTNFAQRITEVMHSCSVLIAVIGNDWLFAADKSGFRRLDDSRDWVRVEVVTALEQKIFVIPVLVDGADMPQEDDLPEALWPLAGIEALELSEHRWDYDIGVLERALERETDVEPIGEAREGGELPGPEEDKPSARRHAGVSKKQGRISDSSAEDSEQLQEQLLDATGRYLLVRSFSDARQLSKHRPLLLVMHHAEPGAGERSALKKFRSDVLPILGPSAKANGVLLAWTNVGGSFWGRPTKMGRQLRNEGLRYVGCLLLRGGRVVATRKVGRVMGDAPQIVTAGSALLEELGQLGDTRQ